MATFRKRGRQRRHPQLALMVPSSRPVDPLGARRAGKALSDLLALAMPVPAERGRKAVSPLVHALLFTLLFAALMGPLLLAPYPFLHDYSEHVARMAVIATIDDNPLLQRFYSIHWQLVPNLGMDLIVPPLIPLMGVEAAGKLFYFLCIYLVLSGAVAVNRSLLRRLTLWPLAGFLFIHNKTFDGGTLNYVLGVGLALWAFAGWIALRERDWRLRLAASTLATLALYVTHLFAVAFYGLLVLAFELWRLATGPRARVALGGDLAAFALPFVIVLALLLDSATSGQGHILWDIYGKRIGLYGLLTGFDDPLEIAVHLAAALGLLWALARRRLRLHPVGLIVLGVALIVFPLMPTMMFGSWGADERFPAGILFLLLGLSSWEMTRRERIGFLAALVALAALESVSVTRGELAITRFDEALIASFDEIQPGSRVLVTRMPQSRLRWSEANGYFHAASLAIIERSVLTSNVYSHPGHHIMSVKPPYRATSDGSEDPPPTVADLAAVDAAPGETTAFYRDWRQHYDYLYVYFFDGNAPPLPGLERVASGPHFQLFRIVGN
jgi:hypothetical protein